MGHQHGDQTDPAGVAQQLDDLFGRPQGYFAIGQLNVAGGPEMAAKYVQLRFDVG